ncbi:MAG: 30S ribosome-binding factor RbfA [Sphingomonadaceae bacterium]|nr:30S ribosome-binding factor RbfA [Sphingomonadaceae bacterium]
MRQRDEQGKSVRTLRVGEQMRHALAEVLGRGEVRDEVLERTIVSVTEVRVSPDLRHATVFIQPLGRQGPDAEAVIVALKRNGRYLKGEVAKRVNTKFAAELHFKLDETFDEASRIDALLRSPKVARDLVRDADADADADEG